LGVDASVKRDSTAIVACAWDAEAKKVRLVAHRIFQPSAADPIDFEVAIEGTIRNFAKRFSVREVRFDPYQMQAVAQRLTRDGVPMVEYAQSVPNLTESSTNLYELVKGRGIVVYATRTFGSPSIVRSQLRRRGAGGSRRKRRRIGSMSSWRLRCRRMGLCTRARPVPR
jgi:hypothetical protein